MEVEDHKSHEPQLSGAYIRNLVKQLSSSRDKYPMESKSGDGGNSGPSGNFVQDNAKDSKYQGESQQPSSSSSTKSSIRKKQVRRRLHTSRPYQERLLNMAEARREIVTALKLHRATMKQATEQQKLQQQQQLQELQQQQQNQSASPTVEISPVVLEALQKDMNDYRRNSRICQPDYSFPNYIQNANILSSPYHSFPWMYPPLTPLPVHDNLCIPLPNQPLGLHLDLQRFNDCNNSFNNYLNRKPSIQPSLAPSSSSSNSPTNIMSIVEVSSIPKSSCHASQDAFDPTSVSLHPMMDDDEIAEIRLIGEQHEMEWNDKMNQMTSAWWSNYLKNLEGGLRDRGEVDREGFQTFDEILNMPSWLGNEEAARVPCLFQQHTSNYSNEQDCLHDDVLPW